MPDPTTPDPGNGAMRLTYAEIAARLGITGDAARQLVRRRGWERLRANYPGAAAVIVVPPDELASEQWRADRPTSPSDDATTPTHTGLLSGALAALEGAVYSLSTRAEAAEARATVAEAGREAERARVDDLRARAEMLNIELTVVRAEGERALADAEAARVALLTELEAARAEATAATQAADALRAADAARQAKGVLARLRAAWRGG
jgi:hypothetical protein